MTTLVRTSKFITSPFGGISHVLTLSKFWSTSVLVSGIFLSALGVVYVQAMNRLLYSDLQSLQKTKDSLYVEWGQLLLEQSTWATQARVENMAEQRLAMVLPPQNNIVMVKD